jgi:hypothetical protein
MSEYVAGKAPLSQGALRAILVTLQTVRERIDAEIWQSPGCRKNHCRPPEECLCLRDHFSVLDQVDAAIALVEGSA